MLSRHPLSSNTYTVLLVLILAFAAAVRFYALDQAPLDTQELFYLSFCSKADGWFSLMTQYVDQTGLPPGYLFLLCGVVDWLGWSDFAVRTVSASAGIVLVLMTATLGRAFISPVTGLVAAVVVAAGFQNILLDRHVSPYSFFALLCLLHVHVLGQLLWGWARRPAPVDVAAGQESFRVRVQWSPACPGHAGMLLLFWSSAVLMFYTNPVTVPVLFAEVLLTGFVVDRDKRGTWLCWLWLPVLAAMIPWLPRLYSLWGWAVSGNLVGLPTDGADLLVRFPLFFWEQKGIALTSVVLLLLSGIVVCVMALDRLLDKAEIGFIGMILLHLLAAGLSLLFLKAIDPRSFYYCIVLVVLLEVWVVALLVEKIRLAPVRNIAVMAIVILAVFFLTSSNIRHKLYMDSGENGFDLAARILAKDTDFMKGNREVVISTELFQLYLDRYGITRNTATLVKKDKNLDFDPVGGNGYFYYLQYGPMDMDFKEEDPVYKQFVAKYPVSCQTKIQRFMITRFSQDSLPPGALPANCRDSLLDKEGIL